MGQSGRQGKKRFSAKSLSRKSTLKRAGATYDELAALAGVSWRMVKYWMDAERTSAPIQEAFDRLTATLAKAG